MSGRVGYESFRRRADGFDDGGQLIGQPVPPEEVLFRRLRAPTRYAEDDFYFANERLLAGGSRADDSHPGDNTSSLTLPESDTLKALHTYVSDYYAFATPNGGATDWRSFDGTALLALGILLEETAADALGENGDMVLVEGEEVKSEGGDDYESKTAEAGETEEEGEGSRSKSKINSKARVRRSRTGSTSSRSRSRSRPPSRRKRTGTESGTGSRKRIRAVSADILDLESL